MSLWVYFTPFIAAALGWLFFSIAIKTVFHRLIPKRQKEFAEKIGQISAALLSPKEIEEKITSPENVKKIMPQAEEHIDHFLRVKLVKSMPMIGMFVGDKTINNLKALFVAELEQLFPEIMKNYMSGLQEDFNIEKMVTNKIAAIPSASIETAFFEMMKKELQLIKLLGALMAFIIGCVQLVLILLLS